MDDDINVCRARSDLQVQYADWSPVQYVNSVDPEEERQQKRYEDGMSQRLCLFRRGEQDELFQLHYRRTGGLDH